MKPEILEIAQVGETVLTQEAQLVTEFNSELLTLSEQMMVTMVAAEGLGIAAPQVHQSISMFIMASRPTLRYPNAPTMEPTVVINPSILTHSETMLVDEEGCLSVANKRLPIARYDEINVQYQDLQGRVIKQTLTGFPARVFQHEHDHLLGITVLERSQMPEQNIIEK
ncbi:peptide deformylase [Shewanella sp. OPT22]|nr:peptide deformylase [Shewanella sp. OPT22]